MKNPDYWNTLAGMIDVDSREIPVPVIPDEILILARELFQAGITLIVAKKPERSEIYIVRALNAYEMCKQDFYKPEDYVRRYVCRWILRETGIYPDLKRVFEMLQNEIYTDLMKYGYMIIYKVFEKGKTGIVNAKLREMAKDFSRAVPDKYDYERFGDRLIQLCRAKLFVGTHREVVEMIDVAQTLYEDALKIIPKMLSRKKRIWKGMEKLTDAKIRKDHPDFEEYLRMREELRGNIPMMRRQGEILKGIAELIFDEKPRWDLSAVYEKLESFMSEVINPPDKKYSRIGFLEEIEWALIKNRFDAHFTRFKTSGNPIEILQEALG